MGVSKHKLTQKWEAYILQMGRKVYIGLYETQREALAAVRGARQILAKVA